MRVELYIYWVIILLSSCGGSVIEVKFLTDLKNEFEPDPSIQVARNDIEIINNSISNISASGFEVEVSYLGDDDQDSTAVMYYCNETDNPGCDPLDGETISMTKTGDGVFSGEASGLSSPYDLRDDISFLVIVNDTSGVLNPPVLTQVTLNELRPIFRSVGVGNTIALSDGASNNLLISNSIANFSVALADNIGVGDALQYDSDNDNIIDSVAFIHERIDSQNYRVANIEGAPVNDLSVIDNNWSLFRAYTSMVNAENGTENTGLDDAIENFDIWTSGFDITAKNNTWNIAFYADGYDITTSRIEWYGWTSSEANYLRLFTPRLPSEVGVSQRHSGSFDQSKHYVLVDASGDYARGIVLNTLGVIIDGLQVKVVSNGHGWTTGIYSIFDGSSNQARYTIKNNIVHGISPQVPATADGNGGIKLGSTDSKFSEYRVANNIVYGFKKNYLSYGIHVKGKGFIYNNTVYNCYTGFYIDLGGGAILKNNLVQKVSDSIRGNALILASESESNIYYESDTGYAPSDRVINSIDFVSAESHDLRLSGSSYNAIGAGVDLTLDEYLPLDKDVSGTIRTRWDIGASTAANSVFRSIGPGNSGSLKGGSDKELSISLNEFGHSVMSLQNGSIDLPLNIGVGDVVQYDQDNIGGVDNLAFIHQRIDQNTYVVKNATGENSAVTTANSTSWDIFRAYEALSDAESGSNENSGIFASLQNFDSWTGGQDLVSAGLEWNFALYADGADNSGLTVDGWVTSSLNKIKIFSPQETHHVGVSQRHLGVWDNSKSRIQCDCYAAALSFNTSFVEVEGLLIDNNDTYTGAGHPAGGIRISSADRMDKLILNNNIIDKSNGHWINHGGAGAGIYLYIGSGITNVYVINNIVTNYDQGIRVYVNGASTIGNAYIYNNTVANNDNFGLGLSGFGLEDNIFVKNNILANNSIDLSSGTGISNLVTLSNTTSDTTSLDGAPFQSQTPDFFDMVNNDFQLLSADIIARSRAVDLSSDEFYSFDIDTKNQSRSSWDLGAHEYTE